jgi:two-component system nitrogen regulation response regulator NtrX
MKTILIIDDEESILEVLRGILEDENYTVLTASDGIEGMFQLERAAVDLVLLDIWLPGKGGMEILEEIKENNTDVEVVVISGHGNIDMAVKAVKMGAYDFLEKPLSLDRVVTVVRNALAYEDLRRENENLKDTLFLDDRMIGASPEMQKIRRLIEQSAPSDSRILITGENGTGKELVAREIHRKSERSGRPFVEVNCAAIPDTLLESELFGHEKGAFTSASYRRRGKFELADTGTLFLDEVADMSASAQAKVLRVIQEMKFERIGGEEQIEVDVRIIAATNKDIREEIRQGRFREDLYFRLNVIPIQVPPLRERKEDLRPLIDYFVDKFSPSKPGDEPPIVFSEEGFALLRDYSWPGNIRELKNFIERITIMSNEHIVSEESVAQFLGEKLHREKDGVTAEFEGFKLNEAKDQFEKRFLTMKLEENNYVISKTAEELGIYPSNLHGKIKKLGIEIKK